MFTKTVLLVEDDPDQRGLYSLMLRRGGWKVSEAVTGKQAWELVDSVRPDAIVLDVMLPDRDGISVCRDLRASLAFPHIPVLILTALDNPEARSRALAAGADAFAAKPISPAALNEHLNRLAPG